VRLEPPQLKGVDVLQPEIKDLIEAPNDLVAGTREYRFLLVPREPGRVTLPSLTLATFDPSSQRYQRLVSPPLSLQVVGNAVPSSQNPVDARSQNAQDTDHEAPPAQANWAPIRTQSKLQRGYTRLTERPFFPIALAAPPLLWLLLASTAFARKRLELRKQSGKGRVMREAEQKLRNAESAAGNGEAARFHAEASAALHAMLEARLEEAVSGLTRGQLRERLAARGMDAPFAAEVLETLERSELVRFSSASESAGELEQQLTLLRALFKRLAAFTPSGIARAA
jgi:hypothetical protein